jgi:peptide chain release factor 1
MSPADRAAHPGMTQTTQPSSMKLSLRTKLESLAHRLAELDATLSAEDAVRDLDRYRALSRERSEIEPVVARFGEYRRAEEDVATANEMARDPQMKAFAAEEHAAATAKTEALAAELQRMLLPKDPSDERNVFLEIRAGTGGDESALFAGSLCRMYTRYAERHGWKVEMVSASPAELGGYREAILRIVGQGAYSKLKFESGGHRVQRVPETEAQGRIHTSACTVAVMPEADPIADVTINPADIRIDTFRASGAGGQHVNKTDSAVRITHQPSGIVVECQDDRSQHRNRAQAMAVLASRLLDRERRERAQKEASMRKSLVGSGDRSERIRTYNFPQGRVTDHRINLTLYKIDAIMDGELDELTAALAQEHQAEMLAALAGDER